MNNNTNTNNNNIITRKTINNIINKYHNNKTLIIVLGITLIILIIIFFRLSFKKRVTSTLGEYKYDSKKRVFNKMQECQEIKDDSKFNILADYDICASYNTGLIGNQKSDYISLDMIKKIMLSGARYLEFHIVTNIQNDTPKPYIGIGEYPGNWIYTLNMLDLDDLLKLIEHYAFYNDINYPLIIYLKFNNFKKFLINKVGEAIRENLDKYLLRPDKYVNMPFTVEKMCNLEKKIIFISNLNDNQMEDTEYKSINIPQLGFVKRLYYKDAYKHLYHSKEELDTQTLIRKSLDKTLIAKDNNKFNKLYPTLNYKIFTNPDFFEELLQKEFLNPLLHFNKVGLTIILPHTKDDIFTTNYNPEHFRNHGVQITALNFQEYNSSPKPPEHEDSTIMDKYIYYFNSKKSGIVLKSTSKFEINDKIYINEFTDTSDKYDEKVKLKKNTTFKDDKMKYYPITIKTKLFLSNENNVAQFTTKKSLFMLYEPFDREYNEGFLICSLNGIIPFNYKKRLFLREYLKKFIFLKAQTKSKLFNKKATFYPIEAINNDSEMITFSNIDKDNYKYIGNRDNQLSLYNVDTNQETKDNCSFDIDLYDNVKVYLYIQHNLSKLYLYYDESENITYFKNKEIKNNNKFEIEFIDGKELQIDQEIYLKKNGKYLYYDTNEKKIILKKPITNKPNPGSIFKIQINPNTNKENILILNEITYKFLLSLTYNDELFFIKKKAIFVKETNEKKKSLNCFLEYV